MKDFVIPHCEASPQRKDELAAIMANGREVLVLMQKAIKKALNVTRMSRRKIVSELLKAENQKTLFGVNLADFDVDAVLKVKAVEWEILCSVSDLMAGRVRCWTHRIHNEALVGVDDLCSEAVIGASNAIYYFNGTTQFSTFVTHAVNRRLRTFIANNDNLSGISSDMKRLAIRFEKVKAAFNGPISSDEVIAKMNLTAKERQSLESMRQKVYCESKVCADTLEEISLFDDISQPEVVTVDSDQLAAIENANLSAVELDVLKSCLSAPFGSNGWKSAVAKRHVNPKTGKAFTRAAPAGIMKRVQEKIITAYNKTKAA